MMTSREGFSKYTLLLTIVDFALHVKSKYRTFSTDCWIHNYIKMFEKLRVCVCVCFCEFVCVKESLSFGGIT